MSSSLESEDLENVALVRMEDVQPSRNRILISSSSSHGNKIEVYDSFIDSLDYDNECIVDADSNNDCITEELIDPSETVEFILPDILEEEKLVHEQLTEDQRPDIKTIPKNRESWPTLEILPGGVINHRDTLDIMKKNNAKNKQVPMLYACAKCPESFYSLFCLVKHVKAHNDTAKKENYSKTFLYEINACDNSKDPENLDHEYASKLPPKKLPVAKSSAPQIRKRKIHKRLKPSQTFF